MKKLLLVTFILIFSTIAYSKHKIEEQNFRGISYSAPGSKNYKKFDTELIDNKLSKFVQKQLDNRDITGLVNYLLFEDDKIVISKKNKLKFEKMDSYQFKEKPTDEANFLIWTGDINDKPGYWVEGSDKKIFKMADRAWISTAIDFNKDGNTDSIGVAKDVVCKRKDNSKPFNRGKDCKTDETLYVFKNNNDKSFETHQVIPVSLNGSFRIETADINKDGTDDLYGFKEDWFNPWMDCKKQVRAMYFNKENKSFEKAPKSYNQENFGLYGCERASSFFKYDNIYYRLFITTPSKDSKFAYLGIEKY